MLASEKDVNAAKELLKNWAKSYSKKNWFKLYGEKKITDRSQTKATILKLMKNELILDNGWMKVIKNLLKKTWW